MLNLYPDRSERALDNVYGKRLGCGAVGAQCRRGIASESHRQEKLFMLP
jgi:hypothetical protein